MFIGSPRGAQAPLSFSSPSPSKERGKKKKEILCFAQNDTRGGIKGDRVNQIKPEGGEVDKFLFYFAK